MSENINNPNCPKCSSNKSSYLFCNECKTCYCMKCQINYYVEDNKTLVNHNPHCSSADLSSSSIDLSDYEE
jgi:hypothetical protein